MRSVYNHYYIPLTSNNDPFVLKPTVAWAKILKKIVINFFQFEILPQAGLKENQIIIALFTVFQNGRNNGMSKYGYLTLQRTILDKVTADIDDINKQIIINKFWCKYLTYCFQHYPMKGFSFSTQFSPLFHFYTPWKCQNPFGFRTFSGGKEMEYWDKMG